MTIAYILLLLMVVLTTIAQYFIKKGAVNLELKNGFVALVRSFLDKNIIIGGLCVLVAPLLYITALKSIPLSVAFFFTSLNVVLIAFIGKYAFNENISRPQWIGITFIVFGIIILGL